MIWSGRDGAGFLETTLVLLCKFVKVAYPGGYDGSVYVFDIFKRLVSFKRSMEIVQQ